MAKNAAAVELGRKGGKARASNLTAAERSASAKKAAETRWEGHKSTRRRRTKARKEKP